MSALGVGLADNLQQGGSVEIVRPSQKLATRWLHSPGPALDSMSELEGAQQATSWPPSARPPRTAPHSPFFGAVPALTLNSLLGQSYSIS